jgi:hypothetical protein
MTFFRRLHLICIALHGASEGRKILLITLRQDHRRINGTKKCNAWTFSCVPAYMLCVGYRRDGFQETMLSPALRVTFPTTKVGNLGLGHLCDGATRDGASHWKHNQILIGPRWGKGWRLIPCTIYSISETSKDCSNHLKYYIVWRNSRRQLLDTVTLPPG